MSLPWPTLTTDEWNALIANTKATTKHDLRAVIDLGSEKSGNYGHAGRKGQVGGSAPKGDTEGTTGITFTSRGDTFVGTKKDGGTVVAKPGPVSEATMTRIFGDHDIKTVVGQMIEDLPGDLKVTYNENTGGGEIIVRARQEYDEGEEGIEMMRVFKRDEDDNLIVAHHFFEIPSTMRGQHVAKAVLADSMHAYKAMGVNRIEMNANIDVGGYAWAKFGFLATDPVKMANNANLALKMRGTLQDITPSEKQAMRDVIEAHRDSPKLPWHIAGLKTAEGRAVGKELLMRSDWDAVLPLDNPEAMARFEHYIGGH